MNSKFNLRMDKIRAFFSKIRTLFLIFKKGQGRSPPPPLLLVTHLLKVNISNKHKLSYLLWQSEMKALIFTIIAPSLIHPKKSTTALPVTTLNIFLSVFYLFFFLFFLFFPIVRCALHFCLFCLFVCLTVLFFLGLA